jgi:hypothetical protein
MKIIKKKLIKIKEKEELRRNKKKSGIKNQ